MKKKKDFEKKKLKVGKKQVKENQTNTSFKSSRIVLPLQTLVQSDKEHLQSLITNLFHQNTQTRQEAPLKILALLSSNAQLVIDNYNIVLPPVCRSIIDNDDIVRKNTLNLIRELDIPPVYFSLFIVYTRNAMTHINERIRNTGLRLLKVLLGYPFFKDFHADIRDNFILLFKGNIDKLELLETFYAYLQIVKEYHQLESLDSIENHILPKEIVSAKNVKVDLFNPQWYESKLDFFGYKSKETKKAQEAIVPLLINYWIEASVVLTKNEIKPTKELKICSLIISILLYFNLRDYKQLLESHFSSVFPFGENKKITNIVDEMNIKYGLIKVHLASLEGLETLVFNLISNHAEFIPEFFTLIQKIQTPEILKKLQKIQSKTTSVTLQKQLFYLLNDEKFILSLPKQLYLVRNDLKFTSDIIEKIRSFLIRNPIDLTEMLIPIICKNGIFGPLKLWPHDLQLGFISLFNYLKLTDAVVEGLLSLSKIDTNLLLFAYDLFKSKSLNFKLTCLLGIRKNGEKIENHLKVFASTIQRESGDYDDIIQDYIDLNFNAVLLLAKSNELHIQIIEKLKGMDWGGLVGLDWYMSKQQVFELIDPSLYSRMRDNEIAIEQLARYSF
ncbi:rRNA processing protein [Boothiomyces sp. JEL0866]|nr:rRNA processing protein [Boothiomyces sp. JEL0866]